MKANKKSQNNLKNSGVSDSKKKFFIDTIAKFCDKCGNEYNPEDIHIVQETNFSSIIHFSCPNCKSNHIATFIRPMGMSSRVPVNSDLNVEEITEFASKDKITSDEVLDIYNRLEEGDKEVLI